MIDRRETPSHEEPSVTETMRAATLKALDLRQRPSHEAFGGAITGGYVGGLLGGPLGALIGIPLGAVVAKVSAELVQRHDRIIKTGSVQSEH